MSKEFKPFRFPLMLIRKSTSLAECIFLVRDVGEFWRELSDVRPLSTSMISIPQDPSLTLIQMFVLKHELPKIVEKIKSMKGIVDAKTSCTKLMERGLALDSFFFPIVIGDDDVRILCIVEPYMLQAFIDLKNILGSAVDAFLYHLGYHYGKSIALNAKRLLEIEGKKLSEEMLTMIIDFFISSARILDWALIEIEDIDLKSVKATLRMHDSWESRTYQKLYGKSETPTCYLTKGVIAGVVSEVLGVKVIADEVKCQARGDPYCLIKVKKYGY